MCKRLCSENPGRTRVKQSHEGRNPRDIGRNDLASYYIPVQLVFQISRWSCQVWPLRFQMTMYFPATLAGPLSPGHLGRLGDGQVEADEMSRAVRSYDQIEMDAAKALVLHMKRDPEYLNALRQIGQAAI